MGQAEVTCPVRRVVYLLSARDQVQNLFGKGDDDAARKGEKAVAALAGIVGLERKSHLHDAPAEQDQADRTDQTENEIAQVVHDGDRVIGGKGRYGAAEHKGNRQHGGAVETKAFSDLAGHRQLVCGLFGVFHGFILLEN